MLATSTKEYDAVIVGGGLVGSSVAMGMSKLGQSVAMVDGNDGDFRASRGNFGLAWVQGKGAMAPAYAQWNLIGSRLWPSFNDTLHDLIGVDIEFEQRGGLDFCLEQHEWDERKFEMEAVQKHTRGEFQYEMLGYEEVKAKVPYISKAVLGASYSTHDGHLNPLALLKALHVGCAHYGCDYFPNSEVTLITPDSGGFKIVSRSLEIRSEKVVLCSGLQNQKLGTPLGIHVPVSPLRGQLLISERVEPFLDYPSIQIRQTQDGTLQIGDSHEDVGLDDGTSLEVITELANRAVKIFPHLHDVQLNRAWGALRVMTPDGLPIYQRSEQFPNAYALSCHSGVTMAVLHNSFVAQWIAGVAEHDLISAFSSDRFDV
jgi:glycine/D-amino acid oxidase-like deaminating enzyme